jgi:hypothetical protein
MKKAQKIYNAIIIAVACYFLGRILTSLILGI